MLGNVLMRFDGDSCHVETYFRAHHRLHGEAGHRYDLITSGRYLDVMARRDDEWRIKDRKVVRNWFREYPDSGTGRPAYSDARSLRDCDPRRTRATRFCASFPGA